MYDTANHISEPLGEVLAVFGLTLNEEATMEKTQHPSRLRHILENQGYITEKDISQLAKEFPKLMAVIKFQRSARVKCSVENLESTIAAHLDRDRLEQVREVFLEANDYRTLKALLCPEHANQTAFAFDVIGGAA